MNLILERMVIDNFKGCRHQEIEFSPTLTRICGRNGLGKTTIADAFFWTLMNKDAGGNAPGTDDFREKPLDENGEEIHDLETSVALYCKLDGEPFNLRRTQKESWVKQRGKSEAKYAGNESSYTINDVPVKLNEFKTRVSAICPDGLFSYLSMLSAFNQAPWQDRRKALLAMTDLDIDKNLLARPEYDDLSHECITRGVTMEELKKVLQSSLRDYNSELKLLPARIDEAQRSLPELNELEIAEAKDHLESIPGEIAALDGEISALTTGSDTAKRQQRLLSLRTEITAIQNAVVADHDRERRELESELSMARRRLDTEAASLKRFQDADRVLNISLTDYTARRDQLRNDYNTEYSKPFHAPEIADTCPTCGQPTPPEYREKIVEAAKAAFADAKRATLDRIREDGKRIAGNIADVTKKIEDNSGFIKASEAIVSNLQEHVASAEAALGAYPSAPDYTVNPRYEELKAEIKALQEENDTVSEPSDRLQELRQKRADLQSIMDRASATLARRDAGQKTQLRIGELKVQQHQVADQVARLEKMIMLCEQFAQDRCSLLETTIDGLFPTVRWKLFNPQINGGLSDCCMCMIPCGGRLVPYGSDEGSHSANTAARLHADVEIVDALSRHYDTRLPLFFDGRERVNEVPAFDGQMITLEVSTDSEIRVEKN